MTTILTLDPGSAHGAFACMGLLRVLAQVEPETTLVYAGWGRTMISLPWQRVREIVLEDVVTAPADFDPAWGTTKPPWDLQAAQSTAPQVARAARQHVADALEDNLLGSRFMQVSTSLRFAPQIGRAYTSTPSPQYGYPALDWLAWRLSPEWAPQLVSEAAGTAEEVNRLARGWHYHAGRNYAHWPTFAREWGRIGGDAAVTWSMMSSFWAQPGAHPWAAARVRTPDGKRWTLAPAEPAPWTSPAC